MKDDLMMYRFKGTSESVIIDTLKKYGSLYENFQVVYDNKVELITVLFVETTNLHGFLFFCEDYCTVIPLKDMGN